MEPTYKDRFEYLEPLHDGNEYMLCSGCGKRVYDTDPLWMTVDWIGREYHFCKACMERSAGGPDA